MAAAAAAGVAAAAARVEVARAPAAAVAAGAVEASSMERREGTEYDFNEPLLENLLGSEGFEKDVVLSMLFISPGRHAGPGGGHCGNL